MKQRTGFTLIEILTVVAVFSIIILIATNIFLYAIQSQRRAADAQRTQGDIRFSIEAMAREVRYGAIEYACYSSTDCIPGGEPPVLDSVTHQTSVLAVIDTEGKRIRFRTAADALGYTRLLVCSIEVPSEPLNKCATGAEWDAMTPIGVRVENALFYITPTQDPFALCEGAACPSGRAYAVDEQPRVTMILRTRPSSNDPFPERVSMQTTVTSRVYGR